MSTDAGAAAAHPNDADEILGDVLRALRETPQRLPTKYFYDERGSELVEQIMALDEYYPARAEVAILEAHAREIADAVGPHAALIEYGSGSGVKTRILLDHLRSLAAYVPVDISGAHLLAAAETLNVAYPDLPVVPVAADYTTDFDIPELPEGTRRRVVYFAGSNIGNYGRAEAEHLLRHMRELAGPGGCVLLSADLEKDPDVLRAAYNDAKGVTAAFNLNILTHLNRELGSDFDVERFRHDAVWNAEVGRIEMYLVSLTAQEAHVGGETFSFGADERILTEYSQKYTLRRLEDLAQAAGLHIAERWLDPREYFSVNYLIEA